MILGNLRLLAGAILGIRADLHTLTEQVKRMSQSLDNLTAAVAQNTSVEGSAVTAIQGLAAQIKAAAGDDPAKVQALADQISASSQALADAITANTPAAAPATSGQAGSA